jgi:hypothetical protein
MCDLFIKLIKPRNPKHLIKYKKALNNNFRLVN